MASKEILTMAVQTLTNAQQIQMLVDQVHHVQILRVVIAATALKVLMVMPVQLVASIITNVHVHHVEEMPCVQMKLVASVAHVLMVL